jgi:hypothetical protein
VREHQNDPIGHKEQRNYSEDEEQLADFDAEGNVCLDDVYAAGGGFDNE